MALISLGAPAAQPRAAERTRRHTVLAGSAALGQRRLAASDPRQHGADVVVPTGMDAWSREDAR